MTHQPWPGERLSLYDIVQLAGSAPVYSTPGLYYSLDWWENHPTGTDTSVTVTVGDDFYIMSSYPRLLLSDSSDPIGECNWIVDASAGSAVVNFYTGYDTGWSYPGSVTWTPAGTVTVDTSGRKTVPLPMGDRTWSRLYDVGSPLLRVEVVSGSVDLRVGYLQVEPPGGLQEALTYTNGSWVTPPEQTQGALLQMRAYNQYNGGVGTATTGFLATGSYNVGPGAPAADRVSTSTLKGMLNNSLSVQAGGTPANGSWTTVFSGSMHANCIPPAGTLQVAGTAGGINYSAIAGQRSGLEMKATWADITGVTSTSGYTGIQGRDTVENAGAYFDYNGLSSSVGWTPGYLVPTGYYHEDGWSSSGAYTNETNPSPHGETMTLSGTQSASMTSASFPINPRVSPTSDYWLSSSTDVIPVTPIFGTDVTMTPGHSVSAFADPVFAKWGVYETSTYPYVSNGFCSGGWTWCVTDGSGNYTGSRPALRVQPPDYREHVPVWTLAPDYVPSSSSPPFTGDSSGDANEYTYEGDAGTGTTPPILWFLYKKWGFLEDHIVVYGQGLGDTQAALHGVLKLGPGRTFPILADVTPSVVDWTLNAATSHAYDGTGVIFPGTTIAPPRVDAEVQTVEFIIPASFPLSDPTECHVYIENDHGRSNALSLMLYPIVDINMQGADPTLLTMTQAMATTHRTDEDPALEQRFSRFTIAGAVVDRIPQRPPLYLVNALSDTTFTGGTTTSGLDDPVDVVVPLPLRWRPLDSQITPRPDLGTGISVWDSNETSTMDWKFHVDSAPFVDESNTIPSRNGDISRPALVMPGDAWMETTNGFATGPRFTLGMVVNVYPDPQPRSYVLSSFVATPDPDTFALEIYLEGDQITIAAGTRLVVEKIAPGYIGQRPIILAISIEPKLMRTAVVSAGPSVREVTHPTFTASGLKLYMGRNNDVDNMQQATMDVLDMGMYPDAWISVERFWSIINSFDAAYGVMQK